jgi:DNA-binding transcriptional ArsR family regulator
MEPAVLSAIFNALSDPIRRQILARLAHGPCAVSELGAPFPVSAPAISKHLNVLEHIGLIARWKQGRTYYCKLLNEPLLVAGDWIDQQRAFWEQQFNGLDEFLRGEDGTWTSRSPPKPAPPSDSGTGLKRPRKGLRGVDQAGSTEAMVEPGWLESGANRRRFAGRRRLPAVDEPG